MKRSTPTEIRRAATLLTDRALADSLRRLADETAHPHWAVLVEAARRLDSNSPDEYELENGSSPDECESERPTSVWVDNAMLVPGDVMLLPFQRTATVKTVKVGRQYVNLTTEYGKTRIEKWGSTSVRSPRPACDWPGHQAAVDEAGFCPVCQ